MQRDLTLEEIGILDAFENKQNIQYRQKGTNDKWHMFPLPYSDAASKELKKRIRDGVNEYRVMPSIKRKQQEYKYVVGLSIYTEEMTNPGIDWLSVYDTLEEAQQGIRDAFQWQEEHSKEEWQNNGITYTKRNFTFNTIEPGLENNDVAIALMDVEAVVNFTDKNGRRFDWDYSIYTIPYKVDYKTKPEYPWE